LKTLEDVTERDRATIGGKAYNCARLRQAGFPVPDGIVVPANASEREIDSLTASRWFDAQPSGATYAVRSSGIDEDGVGHSFAGIHETQLNVSRSGLAAAVRVCRRSGGSEQAAAYRQSRQLKGGGAIGVFVQRMVPAAASGVAFTVNPVSGANQLVINAAPGLGEALVSGQVDPDEYIVRKHDRAILSSRLGAATATSVLTDTQIAEIAKVVLAIETHFGTPQDVEFCHDGRQFWIVQSRPITTNALALSTPAPSTLAPSTLAPSTLAPSTLAPSTLAPSTLAPGTLAPGTQAPDTRAPGTSTQHSAPSTQHPDIEWTRANLAEVLPEQMSPQALYSFEVMLNEAQRQFMGKLLAPELGPIFKVFYGRMYMNLSQMRRVCRLAGSPPAVMLRSLGHPEQIHPEDELATRASLKELLPLLPDILRIAWNDARAEKLFIRHERESEAAVARLAGIRPESLTDRQLWDIYQWWASIVPASMQIVFVMSNVLFRETQIKKVCQQVGYPYEKLVYPQLAAGQRSVSSQQAIDLVGLAAVARQDHAATRYLLENDGSFTDIESTLAGTSFLAAFKRFLDEYGHRGRYESDWALPRLHENPAPALFAIREQLKGGAQDMQAVAERQEADAARARREFEARLAWWQRFTVLPTVRLMLRRLKRQYVWREKVRSNLTRILRHCRDYHLVLATRFVDRGWLSQRDDYFLLLIEEVGAAITDSTKGPGLQAIVERRAAQRAAEAELHLPLHAYQSELPRLIRQRASAPSNNGSLTGLCVSPGAVEAEVVVMRDPGEFKAMKRGAILVTRATDPSWTPLFTLATGVIVEVGGMLSHASTIAREYGLPALANVKHATDILKTGDRVRLDASSGRVTLLSPGA
jgi:rifampicin phosphotransferase